MENLKAKKVDGYINDMTGNAKDLKEYIKATAYMCLDQTGELCTPNVMALNFLCMDEMFTDKFGEDIRALKNEGIDVTEDLTEYIYNIYMEAFLDSYIKYHYD